MSISSFLCVCSNVLVRNVTVLVPHDSPNTDGIDPGTDIYLLSQDTHSEMYCPP
jgi:hypothetical protein